MLVADVIFHGRVIDVERRTEGGFAHGRVTMASIEGWTGRHLRLEL